MRRESVTRIINKTDHWPIGERREYLISALKCEKSRHRRDKIRKVLKQITTAVLQPKHLRPRHVRA